MTKIEFFIRKSRFKESKCADRGHSLNRDFTVLTRDGQGSGWTVGGVVLKIFTVGRGNFFDHFLQNFGEFFCDFYNFVALI